MEPLNPAQTSIPTTTIGMDQSEDLLADVDEPPDETKPKSTWTPPKLHAYSSFNKGDPHMYQRRESLLTRQLHSEAEHTDEEDSASSGAPPRTLSTHSTWSNPSVASTAELTSDDGHSMASPAISPPLPPTTVTSTIPMMEKPLNKDIKILDQEEKSGDTSSEKSVEEGLGRRRCISFACGRKEQKASTSQPAQPEPPAQVAATSPPKRKCALKFVCPTRTSSEVKPSAEKTPSARRLASPPPPERAPSKFEHAKAHRGSDSTVTHVSPKNTRRMPSVVQTPPTPTSATTAGAISKRKLSNDSNASTEATRFHEFASSEDEPEEWVQESTCYKSRLTVNDTLQKEITIRKACQEVEEEVLEEEDEDDDDEQDANDDDELGEDDDEDEDVDEEEESDEGFRTDDEEGFAESDSEGEGSDDEWWRPGGRSTAATSIEHMDQLLHLTKITDNIVASSVGSASSSHLSPRTSVMKARKRPNRRAVPIHARTESIDLPDSTDFVCGTLDEDRPLEQAFINHKKEREAAKHKARPQDIDPTFPTSDPEMDEEDDEDLEDPEESEREDLMHGTLDDLDGDRHTLRRRPSGRGRRPSNTRASPPAPTRHRSPPPPARRRSPIPGALKRAPSARSPPPPPSRRGTARSPVPGVLKRAPSARSPPPPPSRRGTARSPPPRKLFGTSPKRSRSPIPINRTNSPPNTARASPMSTAVEMNVLASRPQLTHTASLPRAGGFHLGQLHGINDEDGEDTETGDHPKGADQHKRGAIDIYKGLEKKRQRRKEKLYQKACAKAAAKGEKAYKVKPGKGAERMREVGLELQRYRGKGEHILSM